MFDILISEGGFIMSAVLHAFLKYIITFIFMVAAAGGGLFCGKKLREKKDLENGGAGAGNTSDK